MFLLLLGPNGKDLFPRLLRPLARGWTRNKFVVAAVEVRGAPGKQSHPVHHSLKTSNGNLMSGGGASLRLRSLALEKKGSANRIKEVPTSKTGPGATSFPVDWASGPVADFSSGVRSAGSAENWAPPGPNIQRRRLPRTGYGLPIAQGAPTFGPSTPLSTATARVERTGRAVGPCYL